MPAQVAPGLILQTPVINANGISPTSGYAGAPLNNPASGTPNAGRLPEQGGYLGTMITIVGNHLLSAWKVEFFGTFSDGVDRVSLFAAKPRTTQLLTSGSSRSDRHSGLLRVMSNTTIRITIPPAHPDKNVDAVATGRIRVITSAGRSALSTQTITILGNIAAPGTPYSVFDGP
jgi:hypothetical protein